MEKLINEYCKHLGLTKATGTIYQYASDIKMFSEFMEQREGKKIKVMKTTVGKIKIGDIYDFLYDLKSKKEAANTIRRKVAALRSFFSYLKKKQITNNNVMLELEKEDIPRRPKRIPKYFTTEQCQKLIDSVHSRNTLRDKTIIKLFLGTGMRLNELIQFDIRKVGKKSVSIIGKGNKERTIYISTGLLDALQEYLTTRPKNTQTNALFISERGNRISKSTVQNALRNAIKNSGLCCDEDSDMLVHILRHSFATVQFQHGTDIKVIQELLGHEDLATTEIYTHVAKKQMEDVSENSPLNAIF